MSEPIHIGHDGRRFTVNGLPLSEPVLIAFPNALSAAQIETLRATFENGEIYRRIREDFAKEYSRPISRADFIVRLQDCARRALRAAGEDARKEKHQWWHRAAAWFSDPLSGWRP